MRTERSTNTRRNDRTIERNDRKTESKPADSKTESKPVDSKTESKPADSKTESKSAARTTESKSADNAVEQNTPSTRQATAPEPALPPPSADSVGGTDNVPQYTFDDVGYASVSKNDDGDTVISVTRGDGSNEEVVHSQEMGAFDLSIDGGYLEVQDGAQINSITGTDERSNIMIHDGEVGSINLGAGNDNVTVGEDASVGEVRLGDGEDTFVNRGWTGAAYGEGGNDTMTAMGNAGHFYGGADNDTLRTLGGAGFVAGLHGEGGDDTIKVDGANDVVNLATGGFGDDTIVVQDGQVNFAYGMSGEDKIINYDSLGHASGGQDADELHNFGTAGTFHGDEGDDTLSNGGPNVVDSETDYIIGQPGQPNYYGRIDPSITPSAELFVGGEGEDTMTDTASSVGETVADQSQRELAFTEAQEAQAPMTGLFPEDLAPSSDIPFLDVLEHNHDRLEGQMAPYIAAAGGDRAQGIADFAADNPDLAEGIRDDTITAGETIKYEIELAIQNGEDPEPLLEQLNRLEPLLETALDLNGGPDRDGPGLELATQLDVLGEMRYRLEDQRFLKVAEPTVTATTVDPTTGELTDEGRSNLAGNISQFNNEYGYQQGQNPDVKQKKGVTQTDAAGNPVYTGARAEENFVGQLWESMSGAAVKADATETFGENSRVVYNVEVGNEKKGKFKPNKGAGEIDAIGFEEGEMANGQFSIYSAKLNGGEVNGAKDTKNFKNMFGDTANGSTSKGAENTHVRYTDENGVEHVVTKQQFLEDMGFEPQIEVKGTKVTAVVPEAAFDTAVGAAENAIVGVAPTDTISEGTSRKFLDTKMTTSKFMDNVRSIEGPLGEPVGEDFFHGAGIGGNWTPRFVEKNPGYGSTPSTPSTPGSGTGSPVEEVPPGEEDPLLAPEEPAVVEPEGPPRPSGNVPAPHEIEETGFRKFLKGMKAGGVFLELWGFVDSTRYDDLGPAPDPLEAAQAEEQYFREWDDYYTHHPDEKPDWWDQAKQNRYQ